MTNVEDKYRSYVTVMDTPTITHAARVCQGVKTAKTIEIELNERPEYQLLLPTQATKF